MKSYDCIEKDGLNVENITVSYSNGHTALHNASFSIPRGTITALIGINGAGKSTLFKAIMGFVPLAEGSISIFNNPVINALKKNFVAYVPQSEEVDWHFPILVKDVVMMGRYGHMNWLRIPSTQDHRIVNEALERVNMNSMYKNQIGELSGGQKKRVFLARALAQQGKIILLDEPFTGVDFKTEEEIISLMKELREEGKIILVSTHNIDSVPYFCDRVVFIKKTIISFGLTHEKFNQKNFVSTFGGISKHLMQINISNPNQQYRNLD
ncbi:Manganese ABC transporter, ATP-binding protein SitB [Liberibacter crescens BT-1]|uniref:Manganese ABC transporter, ATP-binding protein SitB n=1 Tax=Liberibacter crescens (strain BT-1) TaxID=1215343 RepID=L0EVQ1_LIBCB|nr:ATP-binding cassette domain-containing protein [Liberibacter crescens]AGA65007.1 Manganese ABC transporter, ATP-binding protein SitB [Liberibacter crescens BT-1]